MLIEVSRLLIYPCEGSLAPFFSILTLSVSYQSRCCLPTVRVLGGHTVSELLPVDFEEFPFSCMNRRLHSSTTCCNVWMECITSKPFKCHPLFHPNPKKLEKRVDDKKLLGSTGAMEGGPKHGHFL